MPPFPQTFALNTGGSIPSLGLGTWQSKPGEVRKAVAFALESGYKHIDAAYCYGNETEVGEGIQDAVQKGYVKREDIFVTTKLWCTYHTRVEEALDRSLELLGLKYVDLYLMHWPVAMNANGNDDRFPRLSDGTRDLDHGRKHVDTYKEMERLLGTGKVRAIGVANYSVRFLKELLPAVSVVPAVNQIENHPLLPQREIVDFCAENGIHVTAYSPLGSSGSPLLELMAVKKIAERKNVQPSTVLLSWHVFNGRSVLAKSVTPSRIANNTNLVHFEPQELKDLNAFIRTIETTKAFKRYVYPDFGVDFGFPDKI